MTEIYFYRP